MLVGYGPRTTSATRRPRKGAGDKSAARAATPAAASAAAAQQAVQTSMMTTPTPVREPELENVADSVPAHTVESGSNGAGAKALAKPPVRKLAKDLGVDLTTVTPSGDGGVVTRADVEAAASGTAPAAPGQPSGRRVSARPASPSRVCGR